ncbi:hypothetical protein [Helicobacter felis]|uniref:hypothetical protein n=1 Tax=Helicobacter felis TaxID=214 RepID=UPI001F2BCA6D|nr:hypothetical protein [Helicobacter felis]
METQKANSPLASMEQHAEQVQSSVKKPKAQPKSLQEKSARELQILQNGLDKKIVKKEHSLKTLQKDLERVEKELRDLKQQKVEVASLYAKKVAQEFKGQ